MTTRYDAYSYAPIELYIKPVSLFTGSMALAAMPDTSKAKSALTAGNSATDNTTGWTQIAGDDVDFERDSLTPNIASEYDEILSGNRFGVTDSRLSIQRFELSWNMRNEQLVVISHLYHGNTVTTVAAASGVEGGYTMPLSIPRDKVTYHLQCLFRMLSPTDNSKWLQFWVPKAVFQNQSSGSVGLSTPFSRTVMVKALEHNTLGYGYVKEATTDALP